MGVRIRKAVIEDYKFIAKYLFYAMSDIVYKFIGKEDEEVSLQFLQHFSKQPNNQYSYENCWVLEYDGDVIGVANLYNGADLKKLRKPIIDYIEQNFKRKISPEDETEAGEIYLDTLGISPEFRGKGLGTKFLMFLIENICHKNHQKLGLLVDNENPKAERLYLKLGFQKISNKKLMGKPMKHLQVNRLEINPY